jgi:hypothetical protein
MIGNEADDQHVQDEIRAGDEKTLMVRVGHQKASHMRGRAPNPGEFRSLTNDSTKRPLIPLCNCLLYCALLSFLALR